MELIRLTARISSGGSVRAGIAGGSALSARIEKGGGASPYSGASTVTPSSEAQTLETGGHVLLENITIEPIPSNYGLITWNGSTITVS